MSASGAIGAIGTEKSHGTQKTSLYTDAYQPKEDTHLEKLKRSNVWDVAAAAQGGAYNN